MLAATGHGARDDGNPPGTPPRAPAVSPCGRGEIAGAYMRARRLGGPLRGGPSFRITSHRRRSTVTPRCRIRIRIHVGVRIRIRVPYFLSLLFFLTFFLFFFPLIFIRDFYVYPFVVSARNHRFIGSEWRQGLILLGVRPTPARRELCILISLTVL